MENEQIIKDISLMLEQIAKEDREITQEEIMKFSSFLREDFDKLLETNYNNKEMLNIFFLVTDFAYPEKNCKLIQCEDREKNIQYFKTVIEGYEIIKKYIPKFNEMLDELEQKEIITEDEFKSYDECFSYCIQRMIFENKEDYIKSAKILGTKSTEMKIQSKTLEELIEQDVCSEENEKTLLNNDEVKHIIALYYVEQMENASPIEINNNSAISHLIRSAQKGKVPEDISETILGVVEINKEQNPIISIEEKDNIDDYMKKVATIRLHQGKMPRECCDFIIKQAILKNADVLKYQGIMERALEDFTEYELEDLNIEDYQVVVTRQNFFRSKETVGVHNTKNKVIKISEENLIKNGMFDALETSLHECTHAKQSVKIKKRVIDGNTYKMLKEDIIKRIDEKYYHKNYENIYKEIHARENAYLKRIKVLKRIGLTNEQISELGISNVKKYTLENFRKAYSIDGKLKQFKDNDGIEHYGFMDNIFLEVLKKRPRLFKKYPELQIEFEECDGTIKKKSFVTILEDFEQSINSSKDQEEKGRMANLYQEILLNETPIPEEEQQQEFEKLIAFRSENPIINALKNRVLSEKFSPEGTIKYMSSMEKFYTFVQAVYNSANAEERQKVQQDIKKGLQAKTQQSTLIQSGNVEEKN